MPTLTISELADLPSVERGEAIAAVLEPEFRKALLMTDSDDLPYDESFFDLGLTSLMLTDVKHRLEQALDCEIDANSLFSSPTLERLLDHIVELAEKRG